MESFKTYHQIKNRSEHEIEEITAGLKEKQRKHAAENRRLVVRVCRDLHIPLASHDDATELEILEGLEEGVTIAEFPTTLEAARKARECDLRIVAGAPNLVRGGSHSGNVSAAGLAKEGLLDALSSDYVPAGLLHGAFILWQNGYFPLPEAVAKVSANPAEMVYLDDRGQIAPGMRADLVRVTMCESQPLVRTVWRQGKRVS
jgi:alpha-D-ribose 1-methylphosphonate 5-triphosphate diphosphatase